MQRFAVAVLAVAVSGCGVLLGLPPDTFADMWSRLDSIAVPGDFQLIAKNWYGLRSGFAAAGPPEVVEHYSAPWQGGAVCNRLRDLLHDVGSTRVEEAHSGSCGYRTTISSGWKARLVGVATYELEAYAVAPDVVTKYPTDKRCADIRMPDEPTMGWFGSCRLEPGEVLVSMRVIGKDGW
jgi:hypothetical protein